jgi:hypothetical protein
MKAATRSGRFLSNSNIAMSDNGTEQKQFVGATSARCAVTWYIYCYQNIKKTKNMRGKSLKV